MRTSHFIWLIPFASFLIGYYSIHLLYAPKAINTPTLIGKTTSETVLILSELSLNPRILTEKEDEDLPPGIVINQNPLPGKSIKPNQSIFLVISAKPRSLPIPSLAGKSETDIKEELSKKNISYTSYSLASSYPKNHCIGQSPLANSVMEQRKMIFYLSSGAHKPVIMPNLKNKLVEEVANFLHRHGMICQPFHTYPPTDNHECSQCIIIDQRPLAGSLIELSEEKPLYVQIQVQ